VYGDLDLVFGVFWALSAAPHIRYHQKSPVAPLRSRLILWTIPDICQSLPLHCQYVHEGSIKS
jgi:hypothetical protein